MLFCDAQVHEVQNRNRDEVKKDNQNQPCFFLVHGEIRARIQSVYGVDVHNHHEHDACKIKKKHEGQEDHEKRGKILIHGKNRHESGKEHENAKKNKRPEHGHVPEPMRFLLCHTMD
jgi:hypothetical protein